MSSLSCCYEAELDLLGNYFLSQREERSYSLFNGISSSILVQSILYQHNFDPRCKGVIADNVEILIDILENDERVSSTYCDGLAGVGWLFMYLEEKGLMDIVPDDFLSNIDDFLVASLDEFIEKKNFDILHGALGIGLYFLKRKKTFETIKIIDALYQSRDSSNGETKWLQFDRKRSLDVYDFGLAHGHASILYFLGKCWKVGIAKEKCAEMISGIFDFYFHNIGTCDTNGSFFPSVLTKDEYATANHKDHFSRLAWCYGDLGILHTMFIVANWLSVDELSKRIETMLVRVSHKRDLKETRLKDAQFCHGTSGVSYIFYNLYRLTNNREFLLAAEYWQMQTVLMGNDKNNEGTLGYLFDVGFERVEPPMGVLTGIGGVIVLLASVKKIDVFDWNECFFLS